MKENVLERNARMDTDRKIADFRVKQQMDYAFKVKYARIRAWEFYNHPDVAGNCYVAVGGLDSITLLLFLRSIGIDVPAVSVSSLEDKSIQRVHKQLGVQPLKPLKSKVEVLREYGWPVISKEVAGKISLLQNPSEKNATVRHAIITGETGAYAFNPESTHDLHACVRADRLRKERTMQKQTQNFRWRVTHKAYGTVEVEGVDRLRAIIAAAMTWKQRWTLIARACETEKLGPA